MLLREWRSRVPREKTREYVDYVSRTGIAALEGTPGNRGAWLLVDEHEAETEFVVLSLWESADAIRAFAGDDISRARYYPRDSEYLLEMPERLRHYTVAAGGNTVRA